MILSIVLTILIGALVGWLAGLVMKSKHGFWMNCLVGIVGSAIGSALFHAIGIGGGMIIEILIDIVGTCLLIFILRLILGKKWYFSKSINNSLNKKMSCLINQITHFLFNWDFLITVGRNNLLSNFYSF